MTRRALIWIDGARVDAGARHLSVLDRGFTLADGLFETMRIANGVVFRPGAHLGRLRASARRLELALPAGLPRMVEDAARDAATDGVLEGRLRLTISRGVAPPGVAVPDAAVPTCALVISERTGRPDDSHVGLHARFVSGRRNEFAMTAGMKTLSYTDSVLALAEARAAGADEALMLDTAGHLSEASASNVFLLRDGVLRTPPVSCAALPGITRAAVLELSAAAGLETDERPVMVEDLRLAEEMFLTSALRGIAALRSLDGVPIGGGTPGRVTRHITALYRTLVEEECAAWPSVVD